MQQFLISLARVEGLLFLKTDAFGRSAIIGLENQIQKIIFSYDW